MSLRSRLTKHRWSDRALTISAAISVAFSCLMLVDRAVDGTVAGVRVEPGTTVTSGYEEESLFALWRAAHSLPVYVDPLRPPFTGAYFNWFFYGAYGIAARLAVFFAHDRFITSFARALTFAFALCGIGLVSWLFAALPVRRSPRWRLTAIAVAALLFSNPMMGWWAVTVRPDLPALVCEIGGVALVLLLRTNPWAPVLAASLFYVGWGFKQSVVGALLAITAYWLRLRRWRDALLLTGSFALLAGLTIALAGPEYRIMVSNAPRNAFSFGVGASNGLQAIARGSALLVLTPLLFLRREPQDPADLPDHALLLGRTGLILTLPLYALAAGKYGSSVNYYFAPLFFFVLAAMAAIALRRTSTLGPLLVSFALLCGALQHVLVLTRLLGNISPRQQAPALHERWERWRRLPAPRFTTDRRLELPWATGGTEPFMPSFNYGWERRIGRPFAQGGIGGLIDRGFFAALMLEGDECDGARLDKYRKTGEVDHMNVYLREDSPGP